MTDKQNHSHFDFKNCGFSTRAIHVSQEPENWDSMCVVPPIVLGTTFKQFGPGDFKYEYSRCGNPTRKTLEECLATLERAKYALCFSSGMGAASSVSYLLKAGDHILLCDDVYSGVNRFYRLYAVQNGVESTFVDMCDLNETEKQLRPNTAMIWIETPSNPKMKITDIRAVCEMVRKTHPNAIIVVDNTFSSPVFQSPLELGVDIVLHSVTKYINGHTDVIMGAIMTNSKDIYDKLAFCQMTAGAVPSPFDCYLANRGLKTLDLRMQKHMNNSLKIATWLENNPRVEKVLYPPLPSHPQHEIYKKQMTGFSGMLSIYIKGGLAETTIFLKSLKIVHLAVSLGGYESLIEHPAIMSHNSVPKEQRDVLGITDNFLRISIGLEDAEDLIADFEQALLTAVPEI